MSELTNLPISSSPDVSPEKNNQREVESFKMTPMLEQYLKIKSENRGSLLLYRMGDFYELFFDDAKIAARDLQIALTSRNTSSRDSVPMAGIPYHALDNYLAQLLRKGHTVAICDQIEDPKQAKGLVERAVTRILTPATAVEDFTLEAKMHNFLGAFFFSEKDGGAFAWVDVSTGDWQGVTSSNRKELWQWILKINPKELLSCNNAFSSQELKEHGIRLVLLPEAPFHNLQNITKNLLFIQGVHELSALGLENKPAMIRACGALLFYIEQTQKIQPTHLRPFRLIGLTKYLAIDEVTEKNLELFQRVDGKRGAGTLWHVLDETMTPMGGRLLTERLHNPWKDYGKIEKNQAAVEWFFLHSDIRLSLRKSLDKVYDLERILSRIHLNRATPRDLVFLRESLFALPAIERLLRPFFFKDDTENAHENLSHAPSFLADLFKNWDTLEECAMLLRASLLDTPASTLTEGGLFKKDYSPELARLTSLAENGQTEIEKLFNREKNAHNLSKLKLGFTRAFGYYFEISRLSSAPVPPHFMRKQTLVNTERYITEELKHLEEEVLTANEKRKALEYELFQDLRYKVARYRPQILFMAQALSLLDFWQALAEVAQKNKWAKPVITNGLELCIQEGRHPVLEGILGHSHFIPNDLELTEAKRLLLITGPNMAGKSTVLRQTALICILAQMGSFVPAKSATIGLIDRIFSRIGASDNLSRGYSTFMVEMMETARILRQATKKSLIILDEIGRGTSTFDGLAIAWSVVEYLLCHGHNGIRTLFATHYHELTALDGLLPGVYNMNIAIRENKNTIVFLRRLVPGPADKSYGIEVARLAGVPQQVISRAKEILSRLEKGSPYDNLKKNDASSSSSLSLISDIPLPVPTLPRHPILEQLLALDPDTLTPLEALNLLVEWKRTMKNSPLKE